MFVARVVRSFYSRSKSSVCLVLCLLMTFDWHCCRTTLVLFFVSGLLSHVSAFDLFFFRSLHVTSQVGAAREAQNIYRKFLEFNQRIVKELVWHGAENLVEILWYNRHCIRKFSFQTFLVYALSKNLKGFHVKRGFCKSGITSNFEVRLLEIVQISWGYHDIFHW